MVNLSKLSSLLAYNVEPISFKPIPHAANAVAFNSPLDLGHNNTSHMHMKDLSKTDIKALDVDPCYVEPYKAPPILNQKFPPYNETVAKIYRYRQQQGINLGSWFVHEEWMTPSVFTCAAGSRASEIDIAYGWNNTNNARAVLERHWDTFITEADFQYLASIGINTVRLPIGYWNLGPSFVQGTDYGQAAQVYENSWPRVVRAINQAGDAGIGVLVDLHGAVGSQNGQQHSGVSNGQTKLFSDEGNMEKTISVLTFLMQQLVTVNNVVGVQVLNEPSYDSGLEPFCSRAINAMRGVHPVAQNFPIYVHDAFDAHRFSNFVAARQDFIVQDHHSYFVFTPSDAQESGSQHTQDVKGVIATDLAYTSERVKRNMIIGEWSCALMPESLEKEEAAEKVRKDFGHAQISVYANKTAGWAFWSYKKESCDSDPGWCFKKAVGTCLPSSFNVKSKSKRADTTSDSIPKPRWLLPDSIPHRFEAIHRRDTKANRSTDDLGTQSTDPASRSFSKGYEDGLTAAIQFADFNNSKLGFTGQYIQDALYVAQPSPVAFGTEENYRQGFMRGLAEGER